MSKKEYKRGKTNKQTKNPQWKSCQNTPNSTHSKCKAAAAAAAKSLQSCPTLCDLIDGSPSGFPIPGILQARTLEWVAISFSNIGEEKTLYIPLNYSFRGPTSRKLSSPGITVTQGMDSPFVFLYEWFYMCTILSDRKIGVN